MVSKNCLDLFIGQGCEGVAYGQKSPVGRSPHGLVGQLGIGQNCITLGVVLAKQVQKSGVVTGGLQDIDHTEAQAFIGTD